MSLNLNYPSCLNGNHVLAWYITFFIIANIQRIMTCTMIGKYYIKTGVNGKNGTCKLASVSRRAAFETSIWQMVAPLSIV